MLADFDNVLDRLNVATRNGEKGSRRFPSKKRRGEERCFVSRPELKDTYMIEETQNIRELRQWLCWRAEKRESQQTRVPYSPRTGHRASSTDPHTWASYEEAVSAHKEHGYHGIGFVFTSGDDLCGVDLDRCRDSESGEIESWAQEIIEELDSYAEVSPSGRGVHVLLRGDLPPGRRRKGRIEMYDRAGSLLSLGIACKMFQQVSIAGKRSSRNCIGRCSASRSRRAL
jgi:hypothetical protein